MRSWKTGWNWIILPGLITLVSLGLLLFGALAGQRKIHQPEKEGDQLRALVVSEFELVLDATSGGLERGDDGRLVRTYKVGEERGKECPT